MKNVIYAKFSNERDRRFAIRTEIIRMEDGSKRVTKSACYPEGVAHVQQLGSWYRKLSRLFDGTKLQINRVLADGETTEFEFLNSSQTLENKLHTLWTEGKKEEALQLMAQYIRILKEKAQIPFVVTPEFKEVFGEVQLPEGLLSFPVTDLDMVAENIMLTGQEQAWNLIDYEWTFAFPIPVHFIIFRIWHYFQARNIPDERIEPYLKEEGLSMREIERYLEMEASFQRYVTGDHTAVREMYADITPGTASLGEGMEGVDGGLSGTKRSTLYFGKKWEDLCEQKTIRGAMKVDEQGFFTVEFSLEDIDTFRILRWDPLEYQMCCFKIHNIAAERIMTASPINGFSRDGWDYFCTTDPAYLLRGDFRWIRRIVITGQLRSLRMQDVLPDLEQARVQRNAYAKENKELRDYIDRIRGTKAFICLEKARRARNFIYKKLDGIGPFHAEKLENRYHKWFLAHRASEEALESQRDCTLPEHPIISILVPTYNTPLDFLREMIESVKNQTYDGWQLCIGDGSVGEDGSRNTQLVEVLKEYADADPRICYALLEKNGGISENTNGAAALATGDYIALLDHDDLLEPDALFEIVQEICINHPQVLYTDEDKVNMDLSEYFDPNMKPDFSPDLLRSQNYITHFFVVEKQLFDKVGGFRKEYDGAQDYDLILRCTELSGRISHIPKVLYHWRMHMASTAANPRSKMYAYEAGRKAIEGHLNRTGQKGKVENMQLWGLYRVTYDTPGDPLVSVIIPNMDHVDDLNRCISSIMKKSTYRNLEILIIENNSREKETFAYYQRIRKKYPQVRVIKWEGSFNYSAINNFGVKHAKGDYILLLNNDTRLIEPDSIREMLGHCMRSQTGCVGAKLLYKDNTVQHAGIVLGFGGFAGHVFTGLRRYDLGFMMRARIVTNYSAVTAACLMVRKEVYEEVGGLTEEFAVALNDVDFCLKVREKGYVNIFTPFSLWYHYESKSRGYEDTPEKKARFETEIQRFQNRWDDLIYQGDPYYNANFSTEAAPFTLE